jgi:NurA domain
VRAAFSYSVTGTNGHTVTTTSKLTLDPGQIDDIKEIRRLRIEELRKRAETIDLAPLPKEKSYKAIAISVDASNVPIETDVVDAVIIRCADSNGVTSFQGIVITDGPVIAVEQFIDTLFAQVEVLRKLLEITQAQSWKDLAEFRLDQGKSDLDRFVMELLEWGTLVALAEKSSQTILLKDGLLRGKAIKPRGPYLENLRQFFESNCKDRGNFLIGIAKESSVLDKYKVLLQFVRGFKQSKAFYLKIPDDILKATYGWRFLAADVIWGDLYFVRTQAHSSGRVMTIEVPGFLENQLDDVLRILADFKLRSLPDRFRGLPDPIACAHENATLLMNLGRALQKEIMR